MCIRDRVSAVDPQGSDVKCYYVMPSPPFLGAQPPNMARGLDASPVKMLGDAYPHPPAVDAPVFGAKMLIDDQIMAQNRNSRWRLSAMWDFPKFDFCPVGLLRPLIFHMGTKFGAKMLIDAEIMAKKRNSRW